MSFDWSTFIETAKAETRERLQALNDGLLRLEGEPENAALVDQAFRHAHTIKGSAQMVGLDLVAHVAHSLEDVLGAIRDGSLKVSSPLLDLSFQALDAIQRLLEDLPDDTVRQQADALVARLRAAATGALPPEEAAAEPPPGPWVAAEETIQAPDPEPVVPVIPPVLPEEEPVPPEFDAGPIPQLAEPGHMPAVEMMRVPTEQVDRLLMLLGEVSTLGQQEAALLDSLRELNHGLRNLGGSLAAAGTAQGEEPLGELRARSAALVRVARRLNSARGVLVQEALDSAMRLRLLPMSVLFERFPRPVRDLARAAGKDVRLVIEGEETRLDKKILDDLYDPLLHILRNAVDHGIETPMERTVIGKPATGTVLLRAMARGRDVVVQVSDDGRGINVEKVRQAACDRGFLTPADAAALSNDRLLQLLFRPGFTTASQVTAVSGRGVGLDIVESSLHNLKGTVRVTSEPGAGTLFVLEIPLTLATTRVLLVECAGQLFAIAGSLVRAVVDVSAENVRTVQGRPAITHDGHTVLLTALESALGLEAKSGAARRPAVLVPDGAGLSGLLVDRLMDEEEVVLKPLGGLLRRTRLVSAGMILGDGRLALLLHPEAVFTARSDAAAAAAFRSRARAEQRSILLADDALTTREIERAIFEAAGYRVVAVADGHEAWTRLRERLFDMVVADVEMPNMDGITLTRLVNSDARTAHIPVIIISSRASDEDRRRGLEAGAAAYIVKNAFDQENLLDLVERLMG